LVFVAEAAEVLLSAAFAPQPLTNPDSPVRLTPAMAALAIFTKSRRDILDIALSLLSCEFYFSFYNRIAYNKFHFMGLLDFL
jgi:hypothetical protein